MEDYRLQGLSLFSELSKEELERLAPLVKEIEVPVGRELAREGDVAHEMFVIFAGTAAVTQDLSLISILRSGDFFGEIALHDDAHRRSSTVVATTPMRLGVLQGDDVRVIQREMPGVAAKLFEAMTIRLASDRER